jgi:hypothetical protein
VQEIVDRGGWTPGNALAIFVTGSGRRQAVAFDGDPDLATRLYVSYQPRWPERVWDDRLDALGVVLEPAAVEPAEAHWRLVEARWADEDQSQGLHHIFLEALDAQGQRVLGQPVIVSEPGGTVTVIIEDKPFPEYGANVAMWSMLGSYSAEVGGGLPSDRIVGMGMGVPECTYCPIHTSFFLTFQWVE